MVETRGKRPGFARGHFTAYTPRGRLRESFHKLVRGSMAVLSIVRTVQGQEVKASS